MSQLRAICKKMQLEIISLLMLLKRNILPIVDLNRVVMDGMHSLNDHAALYGCLFMYMHVCVGVLVARKCL